MLALLATVNCPLTTVGFELLDDVTKISAEVDVGVIVATPIGLHGLLPGEQNVKLRPEEVGKANEMLPVNGET